jgi:hypothetical protein
MVYGKYNVMLYEMAHAIVCGVSHNLGHEILSATVRENGTVREVLCESAHAMCDVTEHEMWCGVMELGISSETAQ